MAQNAEELLEEERQQDIEAVLGTENGRRFVWRLLSHCGIYRDIHSGEHYEDSILLGRRSVGLWLMQVVGEHNQEKLFSMMREAVKYDELNLQRAKQQEKEQVEPEASGLDLFIS